jgi:hypothetical protein
MPNTVEAESKTELQETLGETTQTPIEEEMPSTVLELGNHMVSIVLTADDKWIFRKKEGPLTAALFPLPATKTDIQISHFGAVQERYIRIWQNMMPRYSREQLRLAFEGYVQMYGWDLAVERSGWGTLEQYAARRCDRGKSKAPGPPPSSHLKSTLKKPIGTISPYQKKLIEDRNALFQKLEMEKMGDVRRKLWHELIKIEETTGHGLSKAVSKLYAS